MSFWQQYKSPLGYTNNNINQIDSYGVDHSGFNTQDELQYQNARINREKNLMTQMNNQGITTYPQYSTNFWGSSADNNYGFGTSNIGNNINKMEQNTLTQLKNNLSEAYNIYKNEGLYGLGKKYAEPSVQQAIQIKDDISSLPISDVNKHQYLSCVGSTDGLLATVETFGGGLHKEIQDTKDKLLNPQKRSSYGGILGVLGDATKDIGNDVVGIWKGYWADNPKECEELLPKQYRNQKYW